MEIIGIILYLLFVFFCNNNKISNWKKNNKKYFYKNYYCPSSFPSHWFVFLVYGLVYAMDSKSYSSTIRGNFLSKNN